AGLDRFEETVDRWLRWLALRPELVAHDLHPGYASTRFAMNFGGARPVAVQHHHAHMAAVLGEHGVAGPALGLVWDGTGAGTDGTAWGGELLLGDIAAVRRLATFRPILLAGGTNAIREPWRLALALLRDAFAGDPPLSAMPLFGLVGYGRIAEVESLLERPSLCVPAHGVGRYFDAVGSILLCMPTTSHEGEIAEVLCHSGSGRPAPPYAFRVDRSLSPWQIDLRPGIRQLVRDLARGVAVATLADRFHSTMVASGAAVVQAALPQLDDSSPCRPSVVLAGGCFQNPFLVVGFERALTHACDVLRARELPPGDGGLAFGQALVAGTTGFRHRTTDVLVEG
ncbi:MAG TPA: carbamoyltransferase HypF, partial [Myxococcota bacterium]|nr:carbamoyltransferase HypF [Myxococcota bacterium]